MTTSCLDCKKMLARIMALELIVASNDMIRVREQRVIGKSSQAHYSLLGVETYSDIHKTAAEIVQEMTIPLSTQHKELDDKNNAEFTKWKAENKELYKKQCDEHKKAHEQKQQEDNLAAEFAAWKIERSHDEPKRKVPRG